MSSSVKALAVIACLLFSGLSYAHPGHDHSHFMSNIIHLLWIAPLLLLSVGLSYALYKRKKSDEQQ